MTGRAAAGVEHRLAVIEIRCMRSQCARRHCCRHCEDPKRRERNYGSDRPDNDKLTQHMGLSAGAILFAGSDSQKQKGGGASLRTFHPARAVTANSALFQTIDLVATVAVVPHRGKSRLETINILHRSTRSLCVVAKLDEPGLEVSHVLPDFWRSRGFAASLGIVREKIRHFR